MFLAGIGDIVRVPFGWVLSFFYDLTGNYGVALIIFAIIVKLVLLPATAKGKRSSMKMSRLTPRLEAIKAKYPDDQQKQSQEIQALYKAEGVSLGGGCLWSLLPILVLIPLYRVVSQPMTYLLHMSPDEVTIAIETINTASGGALESSIYAEMVAATMIPDYAAQLQAALPGISATALEGVNYGFLGTSLAATPVWRVWTWGTPIIYYISGAILPLLSAGGQLVSMLVSQRMNNSLVTDDRGLEDKETAQNSKANQNMKTMLFVGPIMSLLFGFGMPAALSLYWFAQGVVTTVSDVWLTKKYRKIYDAEDAVRLQKALEEEAIEAEKERQRAARRAANPDGITANTSKKKLEQAKQEEKAAKKAAAAREYAASKGHTVSETQEDKKDLPLSGIADRPYAKGRAYDPNRYKNSEEK